MNCGVCGGCSVGRLNDIKEKTYFFCSDCGFAWIDPAHRPDAAAAEARYLLHTNGPEDKGYRDYLTGFIDRAVLGFLPPESLILDFGSGPSPVLPNLLRARGFRVDIFDPLFSPNPRYTEKLYAGIILLEVIEHVPEPYPVLRKLSRSLAPRGVFIIRTQIRPESDRDFFRWWYREDPTHISFFGRKTPGVLAARLEAAILSRDDAAGEFILRPAGN